MSDSGQFARSFTVRALACLVGFALAGTVIFIVIWVGTIAFSGPRGSGDIIIQRNSAANISAWSATFNGEYQKINADLANLAALKAAETAPGATQQDRVNYTGAQLVCNQDIAGYNANTQNVLAVVPAGLPTVYPTTTCGAN